jgi:putative membrane protein
MEIVQRRNGRAPTEMSREQKLEIDELQGLTGEAFDRRYYLSQISAHDAAIALFERAVERCQDSDLRDFAERTLPKLREHRRWLEQHPV